MRLKFISLDQHQLVFLQGDERQSGTPSDGVVSRRQIAEVLVGSLVSDQALGKTFELVATTGPAQSVSTASVTHRICLWKTSLKGCVVTWMRCCAVNLPKFAYAFVGQALGLRGAPSPAFLGRQNPVGTRM
jgi:hypothetical protein